MISFSAISEQCERDKSRVLVHCMTGKNRYLLVEKFSLALTLSALLSLIDKYFFGTHLLGQQLLLPPSWWSLEDGDLLSLSSGWKTGGSRFNWQMVSSITFIVCWVIKISSLVHFLLYPWVLASERFIILLPEVIIVPVLYMETLDGINRNW